MIGGSAGAGLLVAGATIQDAKSVDPGIIGGVIVVSGVLVTTGIIVLVQRHRLQRADAPAR